MPRPLTDHIALPAATVLQHSSRHNAFAEDAGESQQTDSFGPETFFFKLCGPVKLDSQQVNDGELVGRRRSFFSAHITTLPLLRKQKNKHRETDCLLKLNQLKCTLCAEQGFVALIENSILRRHVSVNINYNQDLPLCWAFRSWWNKIPPKYILCPQLCRMFLKIICLRAQSGNHLVPDIKKKRRKIPQTQSSSISVFFLTAELEL